MGDPCIGLLYRSSMGFSNRRSNHVPSRMGTWHMVVVPMNIVFSPNLEPMPQRVIVKRDKSPITPFELDELVRLRVLAVPYHDITLRLGRSYTYWQKAVAKFRLELLIQVKRNSLIHGTGLRSEEDDT